MREGKLGEKTIKAYSLVSSVEELAKCVWYITLLIHVWIESIFLFLFLFSRSHGLVPSRRFVAASLCPVWLPKRQPAPRVPASLLLPPTPPTILLLLLLPVGLVLPPQPRNIRKITLTEVIFATSKPITLAPFPHPSAELAICFIFRKI